MPITAVQRIAKGSAGAAASVSIGAGDGWVTPTAGTLLVVAGSSDGTLTVNNSMTAGPSVVDDNAGYVWWKVAAGTESTITVTPNASTDTAIFAAQYSGATGSPFDTSNSSTISNSSGTVTTSTSVTTTASGDLVIAIACLGRTPGAVDPFPTGLTWANSFASTASADSTSASSSIVRQYINVGELTVGAAGSYSTSASWTNPMLNRQQLIIAFKAATVAAGPPAFPRRPSRGLIMR